MCLAIPGKVVRCYEEHGVSMGTVDLDGLQATVCLACVPGIREGQYVLVHAGFALTILDEEEARESLEVWQRCGELLAASSPLPPELSSDLSSGLSGAGDRHEQHQEPTRRKGDALC